MGWAAQKEAAKEAIKGAIVPARVLHPKFIFVICRMTAKPGRYLLRIKLDKRTRRNFSYGRSDD